MRIEEANLGSLAGGYEESSLGQLEGLERYTSHGEYNDPLLATWGSFTEQKAQVENDPRIPSTTHPVESTSECPACNGHLWEAYRHPVVIFNDGDSIRDFARMERVAKPAIVDFVLVDEADTFNPRDSADYNRPKGNPDQDVDVCVACHAFVLAPAHAGLPPKKLHLRSITLAEPRLEVLRENKFDGYAVAGVTVVYDQNDQLIDIIPAADPVADGKKETQSDE